MPRWPSSWPASWEARVIELRHGASPAAVQAVFWIDMTTIREAFELAIAHHQGGHPAGNEGIIAASARAFFARDRARSAACTQPLQSGLRLAGAASVGRGAAMLSGSPAPATGFCRNTLQPDVSVEQFALRAAGPVRSPGRNRRRALDLATIWTGARAVGRRHRPTTDSSPDLRGHDAR